jgi:hypothetical protein
MVKGEGGEKMKKVLVLLTVMAFSLVVGTTVFAESRGKLDLKVGDEIYACNCGDACPCKTMSRNAGNCTCGKEMVKAKVMSVKSGKASLKAEGWDKERLFPLKGKYTCACDPKCKCDTVSQTPGKCTCGVEMKKVK